MGVFDFSSNGSDEIQLYTENGSERTWSLSAGVRHDDIHAKDVIQR